MSKYLPIEHKVFNFDGDRVEVKLSRISFADAMAMRDIDGLEAAKIARKYVQAIDGVKDAFGAPVSVDTIFSEFYFAPLVLKIVTAVLETGSVGEVATPFGER